MKDPAFEARVEGAVTSLRRKGFCILRGHCDAARVLRLREGVAAVYESLQPVALYDAETRTLAPDVELSPTGLVLTRLLRWCPALHHSLFDEEMVTIVREALGEGAHLELTASVLTDRSRPFFPWHHHAGGIDEELLRHRGEYVTAQLQRLALIIYLDAQEPGGGELLLHPERTADGSPPVARAQDEEWPRQVVVAGPPGTAVLMDQLTWHAARQRTLPGQRIFVGAWFAAGAVADTERVDDSLYAVQSPSPLFRSLLRPRDGGRGAL